MITKHRKEKRNLEKDWKACLRFGWASYLLRLALGQLEEVLGVRNSCAPHGWL